jgi:hypothetical protein
MRACDTTPQHWRGGRETLPLPKFLERARVRIEPGAAAHVRPLPDSARTLVYLDGAISEARRTGNPELERELLECRDRVTRRTGSPSL